jgi:MarR family transcriptional regulator, organic hydroperoxide resistance regulator
MEAPGRSANLYPAAVCSLPCFLLQHGRENVQPQDRQRAIEELVGTAQVFVTAVSDVFEQTLLAEVSARQLTSSQFKILRLLDATGAHNVGDVAAFLGVSDAAASKSVERLVRRRLIRRTPGETDRRSSELSLTKAGRTLLERYGALRSRKLGDVSGALESKNLEVATDLLDRLTREIVQGSANPEEVCLQCGIHIKTRCLVREAARAECCYQQHKNKRLMKPRAVRQAAAGHTASRSPGNP